jgi:hypothetical protein
LNVTRDVNEETKNFNRRVQELATKFKRTNVVSAELSRNYFTRHGLHVKNSGEEEITNRVVSPRKKTKYLVTLQEFSNLLRCRHCVLLEHWDIFRQTTV